MTAPRPLKFRWNGTSMTPLQPGAAARMYEKGEVYSLEVREERSGASHNHYFASIHTGWYNLPENMDGRFPTPKHLRKWLLIRAGYHDERSIVAPSKAAAHRIAAFIRPMDDFAVVVVSEATVTVYTAKSQSVRAMGKADFAASKDAVLGLLADMIGTPKEALAKNAGRAA